MNHVLLVKSNYLDELKAPKIPVKFGDEDADVKRVKEWLLYWQLCKNYPALHLNLDAKFDEDTLEVLHNVQKFLKIEVKDVVDNATWSALVEPMRRAFKNDPYKYTDIRDRIKCFMMQHLQFHAAELSMENYGPWVRSYMNGLDGTLQYWCQGFVCSVLDQTYSSYGIDFTNYYANTVTCEVMRQRAKKDKILITHQDLISGNAEIEPGDILLYISPHDQRAHHVAIVFDCLDDKGNYREIGGNTNFAGYRDGIGVELVDRNYHDTEIEVVKLINPHHITA